ncbi:redox-sensing transcriptional repressor Rex [Spirochaetia bacterium]|nr:redox-sensing transcriptional repressor Rex [Spirochaetia bacterium]
MVQLPGPARGRLLHILRILEAAELGGRFPPGGNLPGENPPEGRTFTSAELEELSGWPSHTIRKDISYLPGGGDEPDEEKSHAGSAAGYEPRRLIPLIKEALGLDRRRKFCVVGLGRLGSAYLNLDPASLGEFELAAGFDSNVNRVEILKSPAPLYPAYKMGEVITRLDIEIALLCVPAEAAQSAAERLAAADIRGIVNFAPVILALPGEERPAVQNVYMADELRALAVKMQFM